MTIDIIVTFIRAAATWLLHKLGADKRYPVITKEFTDAVGAGFELIVREKRGAGTVYDWVALRKETLEAFDAVIALKRARE